MPYNGRRMSAPRHRPLLFAHRGARAELPENTIPAFQRALDIGVDVLETDLHMTADGHIVAAHDPSGERMAGVPAQFRHVPLCDVKSWDAGHGFVDESGERPFVGRGYVISTLEELLVEFPSTPLNVDIKQLDPPIYRPLLDLLRRTHSAERVTVASFHTRAMVAFRRLGYEGKTTLSRGELVSFLALPGRPWSWLWKRLGGLADAAQIPTHGGPIRLDTRRQIARFHQLGLRVDYWTVNEPDEARRLLELGADGIMTDDPAAIKPAFDAFLATRDWK